MLIPCKDCISFALCRTTYIHYPDNTINQGMKLRLSVSKCTTVSDYLYTEILALRDAHDRKFTTKSLNENKLNLLLEYFDNYQYEEQYETTM